MSLTPEDRKWIRETIREETDPNFSELGKLVAENMKATGDLTRVVKELVDEVRAIRADMREGDDRTEEPEEQEMERLKAPTGLRATYS